MAEAAKLKVAIWKSFVPETALILASSASESDIGPSVRELSSDSAGLHREVYAWRMSEDPLGGVVEADDRDELTSLLRDALGMQVQPNERSISNLRAFLARAGKVLDGGVEWSGSQSAASEDEEHRLNALLALSNHLEWLAAVFDEQPSISVTVR